MVSCILKSLTIPWYLGHDGGPEFVSLAFREIEALLAIRTRDGHRWRPTEQTPVEREHQEVQKSLSILLHEIVRCSPGEWAELLPLVEYIRFLTPNAYGITPRDLDRCWGIGTSVERDLALMATQNPLEPLTEVARRQFSAFRRVRDSMLQSKARDANRRVDITNRHRSARKPTVGVCVMV